MYQFPKFGKIISSHPKMEKIFNVLNKVAKTDSTILILGESGTGKELTAKEIYERSKRNKKDFIAFNCATGSRELIDTELFGYVKGAFTGAGNDRQGIFAVVSGGTLFLDEIGDMPLETQAKILRALEAKEITPVGSSKPLRIDTRIIAATNKNLREQVARGAFREDLYYRLNEVIIELPPLRERENDIPLLFEEMIKEFNAEYGKNITSIKLAALGILQRHHWPGNIREFRNVLKRTIIMMNDSQTEILAEDLFEAIHSPSESSACIAEKTQEITNSCSLHTCSKFNSDKPLAEILEECEKNAIIEALKANRGNKTLTACILKMNRLSLYHKIKKYGIKPRWD